MKAQIESMQAEAAREKEEVAETAEEPVEEAAPEAAEPEVEADGNEEAVAD